MTTRLLLLGLLALESSAAPAAEATRVSPTPPPADGLPAVEVGARLRKPFPPHGWFTGFVEKIEGDRVTVFWEEDETTTVVSRAEAARRWVADDDDEAYSDDDDAYDPYEEEHELDDDEEDDDDALEEEERKEMAAQHAARAKARRERVAADAKERAARQAAARLPDDDEDRRGREAEGRGRGDAAEAAGRPRAGDVAGMVHITLRPPFKGDHHRRTLEGAAPPGPRGARTQHHWLARGAVQPKKYFVRVAGPGRPEIAGGVFSPRRLGAKELAAALTFRAAGPADDGSMKDVGHGGGAALWLANQIIPWSGDFSLDIREVPGVVGAFQGVGVVARSSGVVSVVAGPDPGAPPLGEGYCGRVRYRSTRGDYHPAKNQTRLRVLVARGRGERLELTARLDDGHGFRDCVAGLELPPSLTAAWLRDSYVGVTGGTVGGEAVDVVRLSVAGRVDGRSHPASVEDSMRRLDAATHDALHPFRDGLPLEMRADRVETALGAIAANFDELAHAVEHAALGKRAELDDLLAKDQRQQHEEARRVASLEASISNGVVRTLSRRLDELEREVSATVAHMGSTAVHGMTKSAKIRTAERDADAKLDAVRSGGRGMKWVAGAVLVAHAVLAYMFYRMYGDLRKAKLV